MLARIAPLAALLLSLPFAAASAQYRLEAEAVYKGETWRHALSARPGEQYSHAGMKKSSRGGSRHMIVHARFYKKGGATRLQYMFELGDRRASGFGAKVRPPFKVASEVGLAPGKRILAAAGADWKLYLTLSGEGDAPAAPANLFLDLKLDMGGASMPLRIAVAPGTQANSVVYDSSGGISRGAFQLLPADSGGGVSLQYHVGAESEAGRMEKGGEIKSLPAGKRAPLAAGAGWKLYGSYSRF